MQYCVLACFPRVFAVYINNILDPPDTYAYALFGYFRTRFRYYTRAQVLTRCAYAKCVHVYLSARFEEQQEQKRITELFRCEYKCNITVHNITYTRLLRTRVRFRILLLRSTIYRIETAKNRTNNTDIIIQKRIALRRASHTVDSL